MAFYGNIEVHGIKESLKVLNKVDKSLRREITKDYKRLTYGVIQDAKSMIPLKAPLSGMDRRWRTNSRTDLLPWYNDQRVVAKINTKRVKEFKGNKVNVGVFVIRWENADSEIFDFWENNKLGDQLTARFGQPSRVMWKAWEQNKDDVNSQMELLVALVIARTNRELE